MHSTDQQVNQAKQLSEVKNWWENPRNRRWDSFYDKKDSDSYRMLARQKKVLDYLDYLKLEKESRILELGFGAGQTVLKMLARGYRVYGVDISQQLCDLAQKRCSDFVASGMCQLSVGNIEEQTEFSDGYFDCVVVVGALQYLANPLDCLREVKRILKPGGHFIVCQTNMYGVRDMLSFRGFFLRLFYVLLGEEFELFPSFKAMLTHSRLGYFLKRYENSRFLNTSFMLKGHGSLKYDIKKQLYSYWRLKKLLAKERFRVLKADGAAFVYSLSGKHDKLCQGVDSISQKISDTHIVPFFYAMADNVVLLAQKKG